MLHKKRVFLASYYSARRRVRELLRLKPRVRPPPVLGQPIEKVIERHGAIARLLLENLPPEVNLRGQNFCEVGPGDCLALAALALGMGATRADMVEKADPVVNEKQVEVLRSLKGQGLPIDMSVIELGHTLRLDTKRITYHPTYMEQFVAPVRFAVIFSHSVVEHVEDLRGFYRACWNALADGGWMLHIVDLGGHGEFEDPLPPLDFQTYPDWIFNWMYPPYHRATRRFLGEHQEAISEAGFVLRKTAPLRTIDDLYLSSVGPRLRAAAKKCPRDELRVIEFAVLAQKPPCGAPDP